MDKVGEITLNIGGDHMVAAVKLVGADKLARLARKFGSPKAASRHAEMAEDLAQVRQVLRLVESGLIMQDALGQKPLIEPNTVRNELVLLSKVIARLSGETDQPAVVLR